MQTIRCAAGAARHRPRLFILESLIALAGRISIVAAFSAWLGASAATNSIGLFTNRGFDYVHESVPSVPWSIHVLKVDRSHHELEFHTTLGKGRIAGMGTVSEQVKFLGARFGNPVAAVNGDFYENSPAFPGDPEGLQIADGELVSAPSSQKVCFWMDSDGNPFRSNVVSKFHVTWPDGSLTPLGLNETRSAASAVLYTAAVGRSTRSSEGGVEVVLESAGSGRWLPLEIGQNYMARVESIRRGADTAIATNAMVLSIGPDVSSPVLNLKVGDTLQISTATSPDLKGIQTAIGGGPTLVTRGKAHQWQGFELRHPRTAIGWNQQYFFMVVVDGRQRGLSAGMTFSELASYMAKIGCIEAMNLDGGGSATLWLVGAAANSPSEGRERPAANALVVVQKQRHGESHGNPR